MLRGQAFGHLERPGVAMAEMGMAEIAMPERPGRVDPRMDRERG